MKKDTLLFFMILIFFSCKKENDTIEIPTKTYGFIVADDSISNGLIFNNIKDTLIKIQPHYGSHMDYSSIFLNITKDSTPNFEFYIDSRGGLGGYSIEIGLKPSNNNFVSIDTFNAQYDRKIVSPKVFVKGDTITNQLNYSNNQDAIKMTYYSHIISPSDYYEGFWNNKIDKFIGVKMISKKDTLFGWIKVDLIDNSTISIKEYAYRK